MIANLFRNAFKKRRKYPIKRDEFGLSARRRAFDCFGRGMSPAEAAPLVGISVRTARKYKSDWNKKSPNLELDCKALKYWQQNKPARFEVFIGFFAEALAMPREEVRKRLQTPWGLKTLLMRRWPNYAQDKKLEELKARAEAALAFIRLVNLFGVSNAQVKVKLEEMYYQAINKMSHKNGKDETT